ncbi:uncharacterized protein LDX57_008326 [Aspergillus melleus]|uniref:uncharacterized protein n=1 Tax=Aspergillus melleus TaxID=138277 RepID=UPI001E8E6085|nr:uncharacterized protein LDX57_008326 [Aspergillus melleus]KAH8430664.1 hypothetical protein LDX57_008326 [Aspergillus melleus]
MAKIITTTNNNTNTNNISSGITTSHLPSKPESNQRQERHIKKGKKRSRTGSSSSTGTIAGASTTTNSSSSSISRTSDTTTYHTSEPESSASPSSTSSRHTSRSPSPKRDYWQQKKKEYTERQKPASPGPRAHFPGILTIESRDTALQNAKEAYSTQFEPSTYSRHVFWADGSFNENIAGSTGAAVVYSTDDRIDDFVDRAYAVQGLWGIKCLKLFAIGAALRIAVDRIEEDKTTKTHEHRVCVFTDSQDAIHCLEDTHSERFPSTQDLASTVGDIARKLEDLGAKVEINWIPGHKNHVAHKRVDQMAKVGAKYGANFASGRVKNRSAYGVVQVVDTGLLRL